MTALWTSDEIVAATGGTLHGAPFEVTGVTFDSREVEHGWLFVAMSVRATPLGATTPTVTSTGSRGAVTACLDRATLLRGLVLPG